MSLKKTFQAKTFAAKTFATYSFAPRVAVSVAIPTRVASLQGASQYRASLQGASK